MKILYLLSIVFIYFTILNAQTIKEECIWWVDYSADPSIADGSFQKPYLSLQKAIDNVVLPINKCGDSKIKDITRIIYVRSSSSSENVYTQSSITVSDVLYQFPILIQAIEKPESYEFKNETIAFNSSNIAVFVGSKDSYTINFQSSATPFTIRGIEFRDGGFSSALFIQSSVIVTGQSTVSFDYCRFINNIGGIHGALFHNSQSSSSITNCLFENNQASTPVDGSGGAINFPYVLASVSMSNVTFRNNQASNGGAIYCNHMNLVITDVLFEGNSATRGGALYTFELPRRIDIQWTSLTFRNNSATYGGGLYDFGSSNKYSHLLYESNKAVDGGASYLNTSVVSVVLSNFNSNVASSGGGAIYAKDVDNSLKVSQLYVKDSNFSLNTAANGGALYCVDAIARFIPTNKYDTTNVATNSSTNIDYCLSSCVTANEDCGCPGGCGVPKKDNNPNSNAKIAVAIFLPITLILLGIVAFLLWKTHSKSKSFRTKVAPYDEIRLSPASQDTDDQL